MIRDLNNFANSSASNFLLDFQSIPEFAALFVVGFLRRRGYLTSVRLQLSLIASPGVLFSLFCFFFMSMDWNASLSDNLMAYIALSLLIPTNIFCPLIFLYQILTYIFNYGKPEEKQRYSILQIICMVLMILLYAWEQLLLPGIGQDS